MSNAKITLFGCDAYFNNLGQSVFDNLTLPEGITKDTLVDNILVRGGDFECMYGDPEFIRRAIGAWSLKWQPTMKRWVDALAIEYAPLENYDRIEDWTDNVERSDASTSNMSESESNTESASGVQSTTLGSSETNNESATYSQSDAKHTDSDTDLITDRNAYDNPPKHTITRSAYDSSNYEPLSQETDTGKWKETTSGDSNESSATSSDSNSSSTITRSGTDSVSSANDRQASNSRMSDQNASSAMNNDSVHSGRIHGNIGVTTSQQMLLAELELGYWNIYEKITELFLQEFTIPVYI